MKASTIVRELAAALVQAGRDAERDLFAAEAARRLEGVQKDLEQQRTRAEAAEAEVLELRQQLEEREVQDRIGGGS